MKKLTYFPYNWDNSNSPSVKTYNQKQNRTDFHFKFRSG